MGEVNQLAGPAMDMLSARRVMDAPARVFPGGGRSAQPPGRVLHDSFIRQPPPSGPKDLVAQPALDPSGELGQAQMMGTSQGPNSIQPQPQAGMGMARMMGGQASQMGQYGQRGPMGQMGGFGMQQPSFARQFQPQFGGGGFFGGMYQSRPPQMFGGGGFGMNPYGMGMQGMGMGGMRGMGMGGMGGYGMSPMMNRGFGMGMGGMQNPYSMMGQQPMMRQQQGFMGGMYNQGMNAARQMPQARMGQMMNAPMDTRMAQQRAMAQQADMGSRAQGLGPGNQGLGMGQMQGLAQQGQASANRSDIQAMDQARRALMGR